jgi:hypothetical protein
LELVQEYTADGKSGNLNHYAVLSKPWKITRSQIE